MFRKLILVSAISVALLPNGAAALGLGAMHSQTALNQPFIGEIDLLDARPDELDTVQVQLASPDAFAEVGAERFHYLTKLRFVPQLSDRGRPVVRVTSTEPLREPYIALLVEVLWPTGRLIREYSILLDLPSTTSRPAPRVATPPVSRPAVSRPTPRSAPQRSADRRQKKTQVPTGQTGSAAVSADGYPLRYGPVPRGRGLWQVARRIAPAGATVPQTAMALYRNNQHAFAAGDINRLLLGQRLEIPSKAELLALDPASAENEFQAAISGRKVRRTPLTDAAAVAAQEGPTQIKIAGAGAAQTVTESSVADVGGIGDIEQELLLVREAGESTRQETDHLHGRIRQLESQLADIQRLLTLRNQQLAQLQLSSVRRGGAQPVDGEDSLQIASGSSVSQGQVGVDEASDIDGAIELPNLDAVESPGEQIAVAEYELQGVEASEQVEVDVSQPLSMVEDAALLDQSDQPTALGDTAGTARKVESAAVTASPEVIEPPSVLDSLPFPLPWLGAGVAALGLGGLLTTVALRRRRRLAEERGESKRPVSIKRTEPAQPESVEPQPQRSPAGPRPDIALESRHTDGEEETLPVSFDTGFPMEEDSDDADVLSEADIYIAYGRYREAEALLKEELTKYPGRTDLQFKLAEAYYGAGDSDALEALSDQMRHSGADRQDQDQWQLLESMKQALESRGDDVDEPPALSNLGAQSPVTAEAGISETQIDRIAEDVRDGQGDLDSLFPLDLDQDIPPVDEPFVGSSTGSGAGVEGSADIEEIDLDILTDQPMSIDRAVDDGDTLEPALPDSESLGLPSFEADTRVSTASDNSAADESESTNRPETADELASYLADTVGESISGRIRELTDDDLSSELLSSQWQMDSGAWDEIGTKMELALAYMDMDDHDGARAILEEIKREGNDEQRTEAGELLAKLP